MTFMHKLSRRLAMIYDVVCGLLLVVRRILFDLLVVLFVLLLMIAVPGSAEASSTPRRRYVRAVWWGVVMLAATVGGPIGGAHAYFVLCILRLCGHVATLLLGPVCQEPIRVPVRHERRE